MIIRRPLITEKSMKLKEAGFYTFETSLTATKHQIAKAVEDMFKVNVVNVRSIKLRSKTHQQRTRRGYFTIPATKKAVVTLKKGQTLAIFESAQADEEPKVTVTRADEGKTAAKEKKSLLKGTKVKVEKLANSEEKKEVSKKKGENVK